MSKIDDAARLYATRTMQTLKEEPVADEWREALEAAFIAGANEYRKQWRESSRNQTLSWGV